MRKLLSVLISVIFNSCSFFIFPEFYVKDVQIDNTKVCVVFSSPIDYDSVRNAFILTQDDEKITGSFSYTNETLEFIFSKPLSKDHIYTLKIYESAQSNQGISLGENFTHIHSTKTDLSPLIITNIIKDNNRLILNFNTPVREELIKSCFKITPDLPWIYSLDENKNEIQIIFTKAIEAKNYIFEIDSNFQNIFNNKINGSFSYKFSKDMNHDNIKPQVFINSQYKDQNILLDSNQINSNLYNASKFIIESNVELDFSSLKNNIEIKPYIDYQIKFDYESKKKCELIFNTKPDFNDYYEIYLKDLKTKNYESLPYSTFKLLFNNSDNRKMSFKGLYLNINSQTLFIQSEDSPKTVIFPADIFPPAESVRCNTIFFFSINSGQSIDLISLLKGITVSNTNNCMSLNLDNPKVIDLTDLSEDIYELIELNCIEADYEQLLCAVQFDLNITNKQNAGLIQFGLSNSICDSMKNPLSQTTIITINKK